MNEQSSYNFITLLFRNKLKIANDIALIVIEAVVDCTSIIWYRGKKREQNLNYGSAVSHILDFE